MGRGDNRKTLKMRRLNKQKRLKARLKKIISEKISTKPARDLISSGSKKAAPAAETVRRTTEAAE